MFLRNIIEISPFTIDFCGVWQSRDNVVESGEEQYFPALQVGPVGNSFGVVSAVSHLLFTLLAYTGQKKLTFMFWLVSFQKVADRLLRAQAFWVDKPSKQSRRNEYVDSRGIIRTSDQDPRESEADVPLYDRVTPSLCTQESRKDG